MRTKDALYTAPSRSLLESIVETLGLESCRKIKSPTEKLTIMDDDNDLPDIATSVIYRTCFGKLLFASKDRVDLAYASKELARDLKEPRKRSWRRLKRAGRYLAGTLDLYQEMLNKLNQDLTMDRCFPPLPPGVSPLPPGVFPPPSLPMFFLPPGVFSPSRCFFLPLPVFFPPPPGVFFLPLPVFFSSPSRCFSPSLPVFFPLPPGVFPPPSRCFSPSLPVFFPLPPGVFFSLPVFFSPSRFFFLLPGVFSPPEFFSPSRCFFSPSRCFSPPPLLPGVPPRCSPLPSSPVFPPVFPPPPLPVFSPLSRSLPPRCPSLLPPVLPPRVPPPPLSRCFCPSSPVFLPLPSLSVFPPPSLPRAVVIAHSRLRPYIRLELLRFRRCSFIGRSTVHVPVGVQRQVLVNSTSTECRGGSTGPAHEQDRRCRNCVAKPRKNQPDSTDDCGGAHSPSSGG